MEKLFDPTRVRKALASSAYQPYPMSSVYERISEKTGLDFSASIKFLKQLPVFIEGDAHSEVRRSMAVLLASRRQEIEIAVEREVDRLVVNFLTLQREIDLVADFSVPLWRAAMSRISPEDDLRLAMVVATLFDPNASPRRRHSINRRLQEFLESANPERVACLSLSSLGVRPFVGSIALSIYEMIARHPRTPLSKMPWPGHLPVSTIRFIDRIDRDASLGTDLGDHQIIRCNLHHSSFVGHHNVSAIFGHGPHTCLGKGLTEFAWNCIIGRLRNSSRVGHSVGLEMDPSDRPFYYPLFARVVVDEAAE